MEEYRKTLKPNPAEKASIFSKVFFFYVNGILRKGFKQELNTEDLHQCLEQDESKLLADRAEDLWFQELARSRKLAKPPSLLRCFAKQFGARYMGFGCLQLLENVLLLLQPIFMGRLIGYFKAGSEMAKEEAYVYAGAIALSGAVYSMVHHPYFFNVQRVGMQLRVTASTLIFRKALRLSAAAVQKTGVGQIVNLLSNDVARFDFAVIFLHNIWVAPIIVVCFAVLLWQQMGPSCLAGFGCMVLLVPVQGTFSRLMGKFRQGVAVKADARVSIMSEILNGIRVIKMYAWETPFSEILLKARAAELAIVRKQALSQGMVMALFFSTYHLVILCAVVAYVLSGNVMSAETIFVAAALFNSARLQLTLFLPFALMNLFELKVTLKRISDFLTLEENDANALLSGEKTTLNGRPNGTELQPLKKASLTYSKESIDSFFESEDEDRLLNGDAKGKAEEKCEPFVELDNFTGAWDQEAGSATLKEVSMRAEAGKLVVVTGPVGAGKSSLIAAILGELSPSKGSLRKKGTLAYVPQEAWVFSASLRQNVLFGAEYEAEQYQKTIRSCALFKDLQQLPHGDNSLVGDRGVALSGGQKARVNLGRAVYRDADIYLLDDPLSAVDAAVGRYLWSKCIRGQLRDKVLILVTHQLQYLPEADHIIVLKEGKVMASGSYAELTALGDQFTSIVRETEQSYLQRQDSEATERRDSQSKPRSRQVSGVLDEQEELSPLMVSLLAETSTATPATSRQTSKQAEGTAVAFRGSKASLKDKEEKEGLLEDTGKKLTVEGGDSLTASAWSLALGVDKPKEGSSDEDRSVGTVSVGVYYEFFRHMAPHACLLIPLALMVVGTQVLFNSCDFWLKIWANQAEFNHWAALNASGNLTEGMPAKVRPGPFPDLTTEEYLYIYVGLILALFVASIVRSLWFRYALTISSQKLHAAMFRGVVGSPVAFFDRNPVGRVLNRFSKDTGVMDEQIGFACYDFVQGLLQFTAVLMVVGFLNPTVFIPTVPLGLVFAFIRFYYLRSARQIKRLEALARSPVFTHISASLNGLPTIRAFGAEQDVLKNFYEYQDIHSAAFGLFLSTMRWFAVVIDWLSAVYIAAVAFLSVATAEGQSGEVALSLFYSIQLLGLLAHYMNQWANLETAMVSVERIISYGRLATEEPQKTLKGSEPPKDWPSKGQVEFRDLRLRYGDGPYVLDHINCIIKPAEKIGIVGRTGAGKSSLVGALFRLTPPEGGLLIDGVDTATIALPELRSRISIIPQDPVLFIGSLRANLDPFEEYADERVWAALDQVQLKDHVKGLPQGLDTHMQEGGANLSVGQKQLVCLGRALLKQARVLVIDEATANVDLHTDALIQEKIRTCFADSTVLTIAHRLNTIMDSDRVMVLSDGKLVEFDEPHSLIERSPGTMFKGLVDETGAGAELARLAKEAHQRRQ